MSLTPRQFQVMDHIVRYRALHGYSPTLREMSESFSLSRVTIWQHVQALISKGYLEGEPDKARSVQPTAAYLEQMRRRLELNQLAQMTPAPSHPPSDHPSTDPVNSAA